MATTNKTRTVKSINKIKKQLKYLTNQEETARNQWNRGYQQFIKASQEYVTKTKLDTKLAHRLRAIINDWPAYSDQLTEQRDQARQELAKLSQYLKEMEIELTKLLQQAEAEQNERDEIVKQTFLLNNTMVSALETRNNYLTSHVYKHLYDEQGKLKTQVSFVNSDKTRKVVALVNTITFIEPASASEAKQLINDFFQSISQLKIKSISPAVDQTTQALVDITQQLLVEKTRFKVGPKLYQFLSLEIEGKVFPELKKAQQLLRAGLRSEQTNSYVRLLVKNTATNRWEQVRQK